MTTHTLTSFRTLLAVAVIGLAAVTALAATTSPASALPRDSNELIEGCRKHGAVVVVELDYLEGSGWSGSWSCTMWFGVDTCVTGGGAVYCEREYFDNCGILGGVIGCSEPEPDPTAGQPTGPLYGGHMTGASTQYFTEEPPSGFGTYSTSTTGAYVYR